MTEMSGVLELIAMTAEQERALAWLRCPCCGGYLEVTATWSLAGTWPPPAASTLTASAAYVVRCKSCRGWRAPRDTDITGALQQAAKKIEVDRIVRAL